MGLRSTTIAILATLCAHGTASASDIEPVAPAAENPGALQMFEYVPANLGAGAPLVVVLHGCSQSADEYVTQAGWQALAEQHGFALLVPQQPTANNASRCFNWFEPGDVGRDAGEVLSIRNMVAQSLSAHSLDPERVFATGLSAGGFLTTALLATYPDVFAGGGVVAGGPYGCANSVQTAFDCMGGSVLHTPGEWAQQVRDAFAFTGNYPRLGIWHGDADGTVSASNASELVEQWTELHGIADQVANEDSVGGYPRQRFGDVAGGDPVVVELVSVTSMDHGVAIAPPGCGVAGTYALDVGVCSSLELVRFWGLAVGGEDGADAGVGNDAGGVDREADAGVDGAYDAGASGGARDSGGGCSAGGRGPSRGVALVVLGLFLVSTWRRGRRGGNAR